MKKVFITVLIIIMVMSAVSITAFAGSSTPPTNTYGLPYYVKFHNASGWELYVYSNDKLAVDNDVYRTTTEVQTYDDNFGTNTWQQMQHSENGQTVVIAQWTVDIANYDIGTYVAPGGQIEYPINGDVYSNIENKEIWFSLTGGLTADDVEVHVVYHADNGTTSRYIFDCSNTNYVNYNSSLGFYVIEQDHIPWGTGVNDVMLYKGIDLLDSVAMTVEDSSVGQSNCYLTGITEGAEYVTPPQVQLIKQSYPNTIGLYVNGELYMEYFEATAVYAVSDWYWDNCTLGDNTLRLTDMVTGQNVQVYNFVVTSGYIGPDGNYKYHYPNTYDPNPQQNYLDQYGEFDAGDLAQILPNMATGLYQLIAPVLTFFVAIFNALPVPVTIALFTLLAFTVVFTIVKIIRG